MKKKLLLVVAAVFILPVLAYSQKAYDAVVYTGETQNITVKFTLANGYVQASEIRTTDNKSRKSSKFLTAEGYPDDESKMKFYHFSSSGKTFSDYFILDGIEESYDLPPAEIYGKYYFNGGEFELTLKKK